MCCVCAGVCSHTGPHAYCYSHDPARQVLIPYTPPAPLNQPFVGGGFIATPSMADIANLQRQIDELRALIGAAEPDGVDVP